MAVNFTLDELRQLSKERQRLTIGLMPERPQTPATLKATGIKFGVRLQWSQAQNVDGYRIAVLTGNNLAAPDLVLDVPGGATLETVYDTGDVALTRNFSIQAYKRAVSGETFYSGFRYPLVSATSKDAGGAADSAPAATPSAPITPAGPATPPAPGGIGTGKPLEAA